ncbi:MAG: cytochrome C [Deltaproteobacteria bacterium]|nr:MAG: cytochrome C [Deltaproteobacteria bacterium]
MESRRQLTVAYVIAAILLVVGIVCFTAFAKKPPETPIRIMFHSNAGNVLFDHSTHASESGYGIECTECHHTSEEGERPEACTECHGAGDEDTPKIPDAFHGNCVGCHKDQESGPAKCAQCHVL